MGILKWRLFFLWCSLSLCGATNVPAHHGYMKNCDPHGNNFTFYWTPEFIVITQETTVYANFTAPVDWSSGEANCTGMVKTCVVPVVGPKIMELTCKDVAQVHKGICPFKKGDSINLMNGTVFTIRSDWPIPEDNYTFTCTLKNQKGEMFICAEGPVKVKDPPGFFLKRAGELARVEQDNASGRENEMHGVFQMEQKQIDGDDKLQTDEKQEEEMKPADWENSLSNEELKQG